MIFTAQIGNSQRWNHRQTKTGVANQESKPQTKTVIANRVLSLCGVEWLPAHSQGQAKTGVALPQPAETYIAAARHHPRAAILRKNENNMLHSGLHTDTRLQ